MTYFALQVCNHVTQQNLMSFATEEWKTMRMILTTLFGWPIAQGPPSE